MLARNRPRTHCVPNLAREIGAGVYKPTALVNPEGKSATGSASL
jgi:hypothetical protein